jgi:hypothetical protein
MGGLRQAADGWAETGAGISGRYTHRVAISNNRIVGIDDGAVRFRWKNYRAGGRVKTMTLTADEFIRRFLLHVLPDGFQRIRHYGFLANRSRQQKLDRCRQLLAMPEPEAPACESGTIATTISS